MLCKGAKGERGVLERLSLLRIAGLGAGSRDEERGGRGGEGGSIREDYYGKFRHRLDSSYCSLAARERRRAGLSAVVLRARRRPHCHSLLPLPGKNTELDVDVAPV